LINLLTLCFGANYTYATVNLNVFGLARYLDTLIGGIIGGIVGGIFVHRLTLRRDRRKEFNDIAQPIRELLLKERNARRPNACGLTESKVDQLESVLPWWRKRSLRSTWNAYRTSKEQVIASPMGDLSYTNFDEVIPQALLSFLP